MTDSMTHCRLRPVLMTNGTWKSLLLNCLLDRGTYAHEDKRLQLRCVHQRAGAGAAIDAYIARHYTNPEPFMWNNNDRDILQKVILRQ